MKNNDTHNFKDDDQSDTITKLPRRCNTTSRQLFFGVDSKVRSNVLLQNNIDLFEWVTRNKLYPNFWGRNIAGENSLTRDEIDYLHDKGCVIAAFYHTSDGKKTKEDGQITAMQVVDAAVKLEIPRGTAIFLEIDDHEEVTTEYLLNYARTLAYEGYTAGFKANTDAKYGFDREFSRGVQIDKMVLEKCLVWAVSPILAEYDRLTTTHLIHPDHWKPHAPSGITRSEIAAWQYGRDCHPIYDDEDQKTTFNINLVKNKQIIIEKMF